LAVPHEPTAEIGVFTQVVISAILVTILIVFFRMLRSAMAKFRTLSMFKKSTQAIAEPPTPPSPEVRAFVPLRVVELDNAGGLAEAHSSRRAFEKDARSVQRRVFLTEATACLGYIVIPLALGWWSGASETIRHVEVPGFWVGIYMLFAAKLLLSKQPRARVSLVFLGLLIWGMGDFAKEELTQPVVTIGLLKSTSHNPEPIVGVGLLIAIGVHILLLATLHWRLRSTRNVTLLILRVFGMNKSASLTFGRMLDYWKHLGCYFTVVDPSYLRYRYRAFSLNSVVMFLIIINVTIHLQAELQRFAVRRGLLAVDQVQFAIFMMVSIAPLLAVTCLFFLGYWYVRIKLSFVHSRPQIRRRIDSVIMNPRKANLTFRGIAMFCFDNTWRATIDEFMRFSDLVLMDLRGFSDERKGCEYEVDRVFDRIPIDRIVFLTDPHTARLSIKNLLAKRWELLSTESPNLNAENPVAKVYVSSDQSERDAQLIIDFLIMASRRVLTY
jgi:hypothetical protein